MADAKHRPAVADGLLKTLRRITQHVESFGEGEAVMPEDGAPVT
jgi:hypothetical protein